MQRTEPVNYQCVECGSPEQPVLKWEPPELFFVCRRCLFVYWFDWSIWTKSPKKKKVAH